VKKEEKCIDLTGHRLIAMSDAQDALAAGASRIIAAANCVVTPTASNFLEQHGIAVVTITAPARPCHQTLLQRPPQPPARRIVIRVFSPRLRPQP